MPKRNSEKKKAKYAKRDGSFEIKEYKPSKMSPKAVKDILMRIFELFPAYKVEIEMDKENNEIFQMSWLNNNGDDNDDKLGNFYICAKGSIFGGRTNLLDEQRIEPTPESYNFIYQKKLEGEKAFMLGIYQYDDQITICTWRARPSNGSSGSSTQTKIDNISAAIKNGFAQQRRRSQFSGSRIEYACAFRPEFLCFYLKNYDWLNDREVSEWTICLHPNNIRERYQTNFKCNLSRNLIVFGAPGTGKSYELNEKKNNFLKDYNEANFERVTFHPDYSYAHFVGTYKPVNDDEDKITYKFIPGPFTRILTKALISGKTSNPQPFILVIEEINRANTAAVFGDVFQLLDREDDGVSEYPIHASEDLRKYLAKAIDGESGDPDDYSQLYLPDNMFIWATMNSADQGVFPMDTAFKRRWDFEYIGIDKNQDGIQNLMVHLGEHEEQEVNWNKLRKYINQHLTDMEINEDKQLGPYFISPKSIGVDGKGMAGEDTDRLFIETFKDKVLMYLYEDAVKQRNKREALFKNGAKIRYSELCKNFEKNGVLIFEGIARQDVEEIFSNPNNNVLVDQTPPITTDTDEKEDDNEESNVGEN